jgi:hypothetical protein
MVGPGHPSYCANVHCIESANIILDRICLAWYRRMLAIACSAAEVTIQKGGVFQCHTMSLVKPIPSVLRF